MAPSVDQDYDFLDKIIALASDMSEIINRVKEDTDDPVVWDRIMYLEVKALVIWRLARDYQPRLRLLKKLSDGNGLEILEKIAVLAEEIKTAATGPPPNNHKKVSGLPPHTTSQTGD